MSKFQVILLCFFGALAVGGLIIFSASKGKSSASLATITVWGTLDQLTMNDYLDTLTKQTSSKITIKYRQISASTIYNTYVEALATGTGPDLILVDQSQYLKFLKKFYLIPFSSLSAATYKTTYIQGAEIYLQSQGIGAIPFNVDPMVMYWNRDIFNNALLTSPPELWSQVATIAPQLTVKDPTFNITTSAVGLGEFPNVDHAKQILSLLFLQSGNPITQYTANQGLISTLGYTPAGTQVPPSASVLDFYTQFANPLQQAYSWNRILPDSQSLFISNRLAMYFGYASEFSTIAGQNPNLNFDVALIPQEQTTKNGQPIKVTYGNFYGLSISRQTHDPANALVVAQLLGSQVGSQLWAQKGGLPSVRRDSLNFSSSNSVTATFAISAFWSEAWNDPDPVSTQSIFQNMVQNVTSGTTNSAAAVTQASSQLQSLL